MCLDCHFHFVFTILWEEEHASERCSANRAVWPMKEDVYPWHHLVWAGSEPDPVVQEEYSTYHPVQAREHFVCIAPPCTFQVTLDVSSPRLGKKEVELLLDEDTILSDLRRARESDPTRYEGATDEWAKQAPTNLNTYLKNMLDSDPEKDTARSISKRNKRFAVVFGSRCYPLFRLLEFQETIVERDGADEGTFTPLLPQRPLGDGSTTVGSYRAFIEDVRNEVQALIHKQGTADGHPTFINSLLHADLGCTMIPNIGNNALVNIDRYKLLGVLPGQQPEIIVNAYFRQWDLLPSKKRELVDALMGIANDSSDERLSEFAITQSSVFDSQLEVKGNTDEDGLVNQALIYLELGPPNTYPVDTIIDAFRKKLVKSPAGASTARAMLMLIAQASTDDNYQAQLVMEADVKMSRDTAKAVLGCSGSSDKEDWLSAIKMKLEATELRDERMLYIQALDSLVEVFQDYDLQIKAADIREKYDIRPPMAAESTEAQDAPGDLSLPVGLHNIGNTCYLNSLLQYLYTVKPVRDIATNFDAFKLEVTDDNIENRRLGGNKMKMSRGEAVVAQAFVQELAALFNKLHESDKVATRPSQRLANAVLLSTQSLLEDSKAENEASIALKPPPLPARPSPTPPALLTPPAEDIEMVNAPEQRKDSHEMGSHGSSSTLIEGNDDLPPSYEESALPTVETVEKYSAEPSEVKEDEPAGEHIEVATDEKAADTDVQMTENTQQPQTIDEKVLEALEHQKRSSGTDQQDVEEVIGSIISLLQEGIQPTHVDDSTGIQFEKIMETFFVTTVNYTKKFEEKQYQHEISYDRSITAFPAPEGTCSLYDALGRNFNMQVLEESKLLRYTAVRKLPPVLHVLIQRTQSNARKNDNPVAIPETLYLDRYMDAAHDSPEFKRRTEEWATSSRLADLHYHQLGAEAFKDSAKLLEKLVPNETRPGEGDTMAVDSDHRYVEDPDEDWSFDGPVDEDFVMVMKERADYATQTAAETQDKEKLTAPPSGLEETEEKVQQMLRDEVAQHERTLSQHADGLQKHAYRLEAVICHRGALHAGHYWVWIHDFDEGVWRCYNDASVTVETDTVKVLNTLSTGGEPYYLCYVRDEDKQEWVSVPKRGVALPAEDGEALDPTSSDHIYSSSEEPHSDDRRPSHEPVQLPSIPEDSVTKPSAHE